jgi:transposase
MTDTALETALFAAAGTKQGHRRRAEPDWAEIHRELKRKHVTLGCGLGQRDRADAAKRCRLACGRRV